MSNTNDFLWVEKYRPKTIEDCVLPPDLKSVFGSVVSSGKMQNFLFCGGAGCGKTTVARALCEQMGLDYLFINASESNGIDVIRTTIRNFASTISLTGNSKVVILDEGDALTSSGGGGVGAQGILRGFIEEFSSNCRFIITCNFKNKIIEPLQSRCTPVDFRFSNKEKLEAVKNFIAKTEFILTKENITFDKRVLAEFIVEYFPDFRRVLGELQKYGSSGSIDAGILSRLSDENFKKLVESMKGKNFTDVRKWVSVNSDMDHTAILKKLYSNLSVLVKKDCIPSLVILLSDYQYKLAFAVDPEITLSACFAEIMINAQFT